MLTKRLFLASAPVADRLCSDRLPQPAILDALECRRLFAFSNWASIGPAIAKVPTSSGQLASASVINFGTTVYTGPLNVKNTLDRIRANNGPDRSNDGAVFNNSSGQLPTGHGTWYEFTVEPSGGTDRSFSGVSFPGPMRILLATDGDTFFTGDHYVTFQTVYDPTLVVPTIGSLVASPSTVVSGAPTTLTASNVTESGGTISSVKFYRESNGTTGFQTSDTLTGNGAQSGTNWSLSVATTGLSAGSYTFYAVATDSKSVSSAAASTGLTVTSSGAVPVIGAFSASPTSLTAGTPVGLTATGVTESGGTIASVKFYRESNGTTGFQTSDTLLGTGSQSGTTWSLSAGTTGLASGSYTFYAVAADTVGTSSAASSAAVTVIGSTTTAGTLAGWSVTGQSNFGTQGLAANSVASGITSSLGLTRASGLQTNQTAAGSAWGANNFNVAAAAGITGSQYVTFGFTVASGYAATVTAIDLNYRHSGTGPASGYWQYQVNGGTWTLIADVPSAFPNATSSGAAMAELDVSSIGGLAGLAAGTSVNFRLTPYGATSSGGTWYVYDLTGDDVAIKGTAQAVAILPSWLAAGSAATWNAAAHTLSVTGVATIIADPASDVPLISATTAAAQVIINPPTARVIHIAGLTLANSASAVVTSLGAARTAANHVVVVIPGSGLSIDAQSDLDVQDNDLIATATTSTTAAANLTKLTGLSQSGQNGPTLFTGNGITSSVAADDAAGALRYAVGVARNLYSGTALFDTFDTVAVTTNDVLVKFTYFGDADLSGTIDDTDYFLTNNGYLASGAATGWINGDFDYSNAIDDTDYFLLNTSYLSQGSTLRASSAVVASPSTPANAPVAPDSILTTLLKPRRRLFADVLA